MVPNSSNSLMSKSVFRVLCIGYDDMLAYTQKLILERYGFEVILALRPTDAVNACSGNNFKVAIIGNTIPHSEKEELLSKIKAGSQALVISVSNPDEQSLPADYLLEAVVPPISLLHTVRRAVQQQLLNEHQERLGFGKSWLCN